MTKYSWSFFRRYINSISYFLVNCTWRHYTLYEFIIPPINIDKFACNHIKFIFIYIVLNIHDIIYIYFCQRVYKINHNCLVCKQSIVSCIDQKFSEKVNYIIRSSSCYIYNIYIIQIFTLLYREICIFNNQKIWKGLYGLFPNNIHNYMQIEIFTIKGVLVYNNISL